GPIKPILDVLDKCMPVISDLKGQCTKLSSLFGQQTEQFVAVARQVLALADSMPQGGDVNIQFGNFDLGPTFDVRTAANLSAAVANVTRSVPAVMDQLNTPAGQPTRTFLAQIGTVPGGGLQFPFLQNPASVVGLFFGQNVDFFTFELPKLEASIGVTWPPHPGLGVHLRAH